jgi:nitrile hydratase accessory protein
MTNASAIPSDLVAADVLFRQSDAPGFAEPWMAQAFACSIQLSRQGLFTRGEWVEVFSAEIKAHPAQPGEASDVSYYRQLLAALETIVGLKGAASTAEITKRQETWRQAYLNTPHGLPVELHHADTAPASPVHHHSHHRHDIAKPVTISPPRR